MAKEKIISIKTGQAVQSIGELRENIKLLKQELDRTDLAWDEQQKLVRDLADNQAALRNAMHGTAASFGDVTKAATAANVQFDNNNKLVKEDTYSYNELVRKLALLKEEWRATDNVAKRLQIGEQINNLNNKLKTLDASVGVYSRNVGSYQNVVAQLGNSLGTISHLAPGLSRGITGVTVGFKALSATPAVAILGLLANVLTKIIDGLESSEENTQALTKAMAPLKAIGDAFTKTLQLMGKGLVAVVEWFGKLTQSILGTTDAMKERQKIAEEEVALTQKQRETLIANAEAERDIAELRAKSSEKMKYTASERLAFLEEAGRLEAEISARALEDAKKQYEIIKAKNSLTQTSTEEKRKEAEAYAAMVKAETDYYQAIRTINTGITRARREEAKDAREAAKAVKEAAVAKINAEKDYLAQVLEVTKAGTDRQLELQNEIAAKERDAAKANARQKITDREALAKTLEAIDAKYNLAVEKNTEDHYNTVQAQTLQAIANRRDALQKGSVEYAQAQKEYAAAVLDGLRQQMDETDAEFEARQLEAQRSMVEAGNALNDALAKETADGLKAEMAALREGSVEQLALALELAKENFANTYQGIDESLDEFNARRLAAAKEVRQAEDELQEAQIDQDRIILEQRMAGLDQNSLEYLSHALELKQFELDSLHQMEGESNEEFRLRQLQAEKEYADAKKAIWQGSVQMMSQVAGSISSIIGSIADAYDEDAKNNKAAAIKAKNLRIAGATIDMLSGAVAAYSGAQNIPPPAGPIIGAINAAAVVAMGLANIAKIKATQISTESGSAANPTVPAAVNAPTLEAEVNQVRTVTSATEEDRLNQMASEQRVYILDSDIQAKNNQNRVEVKETTF